jgi:tetratricopeptide (TPR) repeat protein
VRFSSWKVLIPFLIAADLFVLWVWAARPRRFYQDWLGMGGFADDAPVGRVVDWARWQNGPRTPSGFVSLFGIGELFFAGVLLLALVLLVALPLVAWRSNSSLWRRLSAPIGWASALAIRFRVRTVLAAIAILGLYLGWEILAWRAWRLRSVYLRNAYQAAVGQSGDLSQLRTRRRMLADLMRLPMPQRDDAAPEQGYHRSKAASVARLLADRDRLNREITQLSARVAARAAFQRKYERAADDPRKPVAPDHSFPEPILDADYLSANGDYPRALAAYDELTRTFPDLFEAHFGLAWIRATCRDAQYRDGKLAVASATRVCELSNWLDIGALAVLAAAYAETGDFASAVKWQQKAISLTAKPAGARSFQSTRKAMPLTEKIAAAGSLEDRLALYVAGKPYRQE